MKKDHKEQNNITTLSCVEGRLVQYFFIPVSAGATEEFLLFPLGKTVGMDRNAFWWFLMLHYEY
jgi:hypothetical protein